MRDADGRVVRGWRMDLEAMNLREGVEPVAGLVRGRAVGRQLDLARAEAIAEENAGRVGWDLADDLEVRRGQLLVADIKLPRSRVVLLVSPAWE